ncbi:hypothetical protein FOA43_000038 [Brettanomyces nanus]|uniref:Tr-type G domain-containing protein n=1 Tax=Eeniella nana TaxID=13502 RepID=A0A875RSP8_EENNA|nr:uncharacterized protein FOA43_000038 [Brettanomyces nanus]QPG72737.1 hypothetical protein FOA43_000038 [Brettanomyces nanus]
MDEYDEFGNPIGGSAGESSESSSISSEDHDELKQIVENEESDHEEKGIETSSNQIILPEDKAYYPSAEEVFGSEVETIVATVDAKNINEPIVEPLDEEAFKIEEKDLPETMYSKQYMWELMKIPSKVRNVALCGSLHSGKTSFVDMLVNETHKLSTPSSRYTDNQTLEVDRGITIKASTMTMLLGDISGHSLVVNLIDAPGHTNFIDEVAASVRLADTMVIVVDALEGVTKSVELALKIAVNTNTEICLMVSKIDRLIMEVRLTPLDAYYKIRKTIEEVNDVLKAVGGENVSPVLSPALGNVCFESATFNICFTLMSFAKLYIQQRKLNAISAYDLAAKFWGDSYFLDGKFTKITDDVLGSASSRTFVKFILEPIYKIVTRAITLDPENLEEFVRKKLGILDIRHPEFKKDPRVLLKRLLGSYFGLSSSPFAEMLRDIGPSPIRNAPNKLKSLYVSEKLDSITEHVQKCDCDGPLIAYVSKLVNSRDGSRFYAELRVLSGTLKPSSSVKLLGESYSQEFAEDMKVQDVRRTFLECGRYRIKVEGIPAGSIGLISGHGIDSFITKTATIYDIHIPDDQMHIFKPMGHVLQPVFKVAVQPFNPSDMAKFTEGLKHTNQSYTGCEIKVEEGGEHAIIGYGELYMDCLLRDLRKLYTKIDIKVSDPMTRFAETCVDMSMVKLDIKSNNQKNSITIIAEPLDPQISSDLEGALITMSTPARKMSKIFRQKYGWDALAANSIWAFGPVENHSTCVLCDDTLPDETNKDSLMAVKESVIQGFRWAAREGPLCDEPIRDVRFRIIDARISPDFIEANSAQIIQMVRKACHCALMTGTPRLLEPLFEIEITCLSKIAGKMGRFLDKRRGSIIYRSFIDGTPLSKVIGMVPVIDSVGLETDIRLLTDGKAMCQSVFTKWQVTPGDPMDSTCYIPLLKPAPIKSLARDFTMKTRKRKGLDDEPSLQRYVDEETWHKLQSTGLFE